MVPTPGRPVLETPGRTFVLDAFPILTSSTQRLVFIGFNNVFFGIDYFSTSASTASLTSTLLTRFQAKPMYAFIPDVRLVLAKLGSHLVHHGSDCIVSGIDIHLRRLSRRVFVILYAHYASTASCASTLTPAPDHDIDHGNPSHGYLDQGCIAQRSRLPRHRHKGLSPRVSISPASSAVQASAPRHLPRCSRSYCRGMSAGSTLVSLQSDRPPCSYC
jgi:hypothetical protein